MMRPSAVTSLLVLFLAFQNLDHPIIKKEQTLAFEQLLHFNPASSIPSTVIYSTRFDVHKKCSSIPDPNRTIHIARRDTWQLLTHEDSSLLLYSAYRDQRLADGDYLRFLGMSEGKFADRVFCRIWFDEDGGQAVVEADYHELWVSKWDSAPPGEYLRPMLLSCPYPKGVTPVAASLVPEPCVEPSNIFPFDVKPPDPKDVKNFVVCLKPLDFAQKDVTHRLLEWLELQFLLGADDVAVYTLRDRPPHPRVSEVLAGYANKSGRVTIKSHVFPGGEDNGGLWQKRRHEMLVYNDCFYRHVHTHRWVVNLDLDEAIVPQQDDTWMKLLDRVAKKNPRALKAASISAPNVYFFDQFGVDPSDDVPEYFHMLKHLFRSSNFTPAGFAQKSFCSTLLTQSVTHHYPLRGLHPFLRLSVPGGRDLLRLHHYRASCPTGMASECEANYMRYLERDRGILRFKEPLVSNVQKRIKELNVSISG